MNFAYETDNHLPVEGYIFAFLDSLFPFNLTSSMHFILTVLYTFCKSASIFVTYYT